MCAVEICAHVYLDLHLRCWTYGSGSDGRLLTLVVLAQVIGRSRETLSFFCFEMSKGIHYEDMVQLHHK